MNEAANAPLLAWRKRRPWSEVSDAERRARSRKDDRQLSMFGAQHTRELRLPKSVRLKVPVPRYSPDSFDAGF